VTAAIVEPIRRPTTEDEYVERFLALHSAGIERIVQQGQVLDEAATVLRPTRGAWTRFTTRLSITSRHVNRLRSVAGHEVLRNRTFWSRLPAELVTLYAISRLPADFVLAAIESGRIHPGMSLKDAKALMDPSAKPGASKTREPKPWNLSTAFKRIHAALRPAPPSAFKEISIQLLELSAAYAPSRSQSKSRTESGPKSHTESQSESRSSRGAGRNAKPDMKVVKDVISSGLRSLAARYHPDRGGDPEMMKVITAAVDWLRAKVGA
jgi:hypothetical protein